MNVLPWPGPRWDIEVAPCAEPGTTGFTFPATWNGMAVTATATASDGQLTIEPLAGQRLEIPAPVVVRLFPQATAQMIVHTRSPPDDLPPGASASG